MPAAARAPARSTRSRSASRGGTSCRAPSGPQRQLTETVRATQPGPLARPPAGHRRPPRRRPRRGLGRSPSAATRSTPPSSALDPTGCARSSDTLRPQAAAAPTDDLTPRRVGGEPAGQRRPAEGSCRRARPTSCGSTQARLDELVARAAEVSVGAQRHRPLRPRRRRPRARARGPAPGGAESCRADVTAKRIGAVAASPSRSIVGACSCARRHRRRRCRRRRHRRRHGAAERQPPRSCAAPSSPRRARAIAGRPRARRDGRGRPARRSTASPRSRRRRGPVWLTVAAVPGDGRRRCARRRADPLGCTTDAARRSQLGVATPAGRRADVLADRLCGAPLWRCIGDHAGAPWTDLGGERGVGHASARRSAPSTRDGAAPGVVRRRRRRLLRQRRRSAATPLGAIRRSSRGCAGSPAPSSDVALSAGTPLATMATRPARSTSPPPPTPSCAALGATAIDSTPTTLSRPCGWRRCWRCPTGPPSPTTSPTTPPSARGAGWDDAGDGRPQPLPGASTMLALRTLWHGGRHDREPTAMASGARRRRARRGAAAGRRRTTWRRRRRRRRCRRRRDLGDGRPRRLHRRRHGRQQREDRAARPTSPTSSTTPTAPRSTGAASSCARAAWRRACAADADPRGLAEPRGQRRAAGDLVAGGVGLGRHRQRARRRGAGAGRHAVHAHAARHRHAQADGRGARLAGRADRLRRPRCRSPTTPRAGASVGHPEWGPFRLGKTNPNFSTSGLNFTIAEYYAATGKTAGPHDRGPRPARPPSSSPAQIESSVVHYGDITMTFLNNWFAADARGTSLTYASAVAVEEKSVIDYNLGNPDGVLVARRGAARRRAVPLVAIYPEEGTLYSDNPFIVLDTEWVDADEKAAAALFEDVRPAAREPAARCSSSGSGRTTRRSPLADPIVAGQRRRPDPADGRAARCRRPRCSSASSTRGPSCARRPGCCSCSTSPGRWASSPATTARPSSTSPRQAAVSALDQFKDDRRGRAVGVQHRPRRRPTRTCRELVPVGPIGEQPRRPRRSRSSAQFPTNGTPLYEVTEQSYETMLEQLRPGRRSTPSCCSPTARTTTASRPTTTSSSPT